MKVCQPGANSPGRRQRGIRCDALCLLVRIISQDEAQQQSRHHHIAQSQHGEVARVVEAGENELSGQIQLWCVPHNPAQMQLSSHDSHWIVGGSRGHLDHHVGAEDVRGEEHPEDIVDEQAGQQQRGHLQAGQTHKRNERHT